MKKIALSALFLVISASSINAQNTANKEVKTGKEYNKWSLDLNGGFSKPTSPFVPGYYVSNSGLFHVDLGARYMINPKFGFKVDFGYDSFKNETNTPDFDGQYVRANIQGVVNLGRTLNLEDLSKNVNLQFHVGPGYAFMNNDNFNGTDNMTNLLVGLTGQIKLSDRVALNGDFTLINNISQHYSFDGTQYSGSISEDRGFNGSLYNASIGLSIYLGKYAKHADWYIQDKLDDKLEALKVRVGDLETMMNDSDKDGVPDYLDVENNSVAGVAVDTKGRMVDMNYNRIADELEQFISNNYVNKSEFTNNESGNDKLNIIKEFINNGYVCTYFDLNKSIPTNVSTEGIDFVLTYLRTNPSGTVDIIGSADETGETEANNILATSRANNVKNILVKAGVNPTRLNVVSKGEDKSVEKESDGARKLVRKVTFKVK
jgi:OOP family OmpA-OmpF porin